MRRPSTAPGPTREPKRFGAVAQLGERRNGIAKVRGSIPLGSTTLHQDIVTAANSPKQPLPFEAAKVEVEVEKEDADLAADDLDIDVDAEAEENPDDEVDLGGDDDIGVPGAADDEEEV